MCAQGARNSWSALLVKVLLLLWLFASTCAVTMHILWRMHWSERHQTERFFLTLQWRYCERGLTPLTSCKKHFYKPTRPKLLNCRGVSYECKTFCNYNNPLLCKKDVA